MRDPRARNPSSCARRPTRSPSSCWRARARGASGSRRRRASRPRALLASRREELAQLQTEAEDQAQEIKAQARDEARDDHQRGARRRARHPQRGHGGLAQPARAVELAAQQRRAPAARRAPDPRRHDRPPRPGHLRQRTRADERARGSARGDGERRRFADARAATARGARERWVERRPGRAGVHPAGVRGGAAVIPAGRCGPNVEQPGSADQMGARLRARACHRPAAIGSRDESHRAGRLQFPS